MWGVFLTYVPIGGSVAFLLGYLSGSEYVALAVCAAWMIGYVVTGAIASTTRCPRCGNRFASKWWYHNPWTQRCLHCKLPLSGRSQGSAGS